MKRLVRMLPGMGRFSTCKDLGDAMPRALHDVFAPGLNDLRRLAGLTQSLVVTDWPENREMQQVLAGCRKALQAR